MNEHDIAIKGGCIGGPHIRGEVDDCDHCRAWRRVDPDQEPSIEGDNVSALTRMLCPCGGSAWSIAELEALCSTEDEKEMYRSILGPGSYYCADEDDVLLDGEAKPRVCS